MQHTGHFEESLHIFRSLAHRANVLVEWYDLGFVYLLNDLPDSADVAFHRILEIDPSYWDARFGLAESRAHRGDLEAAISMNEDLVASGTLDELIEREGIISNAFGAGLALYYYESGRFAQTLAACDTTHYRCLGLWLRMGETEAVLERARSLAASEGARRRSHAIRYRGFALAAIDSLDTARDMAQQLYALEPNRGGLVRNRADQISVNIALAEGDPTTALEILARMKKAGTSGGGLYDVEYREALAEAYRQAGRFDDAVETLRTLLRSYGWHSMAYLQLGRIYQEMGKTKEAEEALVTFLDRWKNADEGLPDLEDARARLAAIRQM